MKCAVCKREIPARDDWHGFEIGCYCEPVGLEDQLCEDHGCCELARTHDPVYMCDACYQDNKSHIIETVMMALGIFFAVDLEAPVCEISE